MAESTSDGNLTCDIRVTIYFPVDFLEHETSGFLYGDYEPCETNSVSNTCVYITSISEKIQTDKSKGTLLGMYNSSADYVLHSHIWMEFEGKELNFKNLQLGNINIPFCNSLLIMYDPLLLQSELLDHNINWVKSGTLQGLKRVMTKTCDVQEPFEVEQFSNIPVPMLSKVIHQLHYRFYQWTILSKTKTKAEHCNLLFTIFSDFLLGLVFLLLIHTIGGPSSVIQLFSTSFKIVADNLQDLVEWLNGVPVGLKLNRQFSMVLARFFLYHLYLWKTYIDIITLILSTVLTVLMFISILGLSFQIALLSDMIKLASLHAYCFYVYAARLYGVALQGLLSTLRMFRGSKWNPLRQRVDSGHFSWDQLCIGMFIASSLLLLLPTILVYYVVFLLLRVVILMVQGMLERLIWLINSIPIYSFLLWLSNSPTIAGDVRFEVLTSSDNKANRPAALKLLGIKLSLIETLRLSVNGRTAAEWPTTNWFQMLTSIVTGKLIYPL